MAKWKPAMDANSKRVESLRFSLRTLRKIIIDPNLTDHDIQEIRSKISQAEKELHHLEQPLLLGDVANELLVEIKSRRKFENSCEKIGKCFC